LVDKSSSKYESIQHRIFVITLHLPKRIAYNKKTWKMLRNTMLTAYSSPTINKYQVGINRVSTHKLPVHFIDVLFLIVNKT